MADNKKSEENSEEKAVAKEEKYIKSQIVGSDRYRNRADILNVLLEDNTDYTLSEIDKKLKDFFWHSHNFFLQLLSKTFQLLLFLQNLEEVWQD